MVIDVLANKKLVRIWLTNEEQKLPGLQARLRPLYRKYKKKKYLVAVYFSGKDDLIELTRDLLIHNKQRMVN